MLQYLTKALDAVVAILPGLAVVIVAAIVVFKALLPTFVRKLTSVYVILQKADSVLDAVIAQFPANELLAKLDLIVEAVIKALEDGGITVDGALRSLITQRASAEIDRVRTNAAIV